jgi:Fe(3+) dicitrate transport protein
MTYQCGARRVRLDQLIAKISGIALTGIVCLSGAAQQAASQSADEAATEVLPEITVETIEPEQKKYPAAAPAKKPTKSTSTAQPVAQAQAGDPSQQSSEQSGASTSVAQNGLPSVVIVGDIIGGREGLVDLSGSGATVEGEELYQSHVLTTNEALRKVPGVVVRDEEGLGIRPNISIRGLNPTRSTKALLLEDGLFLTYAPYGDNASYFHPSLDRFERVEVMKGADQLRYGPQTISGTINYVTPNPPAKPSGFIAATGGNRDYFNGQMFYGGWIGGFGGLVDYVHKEGQGARDNTEHEIDDFGAKGIVQLSPEAALIAKGSYFKEDSQVTYTGITDAEARNFGLRYNPFDNDNFDTERYASSLTLSWDLNAYVHSQTSLYWTWFSRDWWRQSSQTLDGQCGGAFRTDRLNGVAVDPDDCNSIQGRLRDYFTRGIEQRWDFQAELSDLIRNELRVGWRLHREDQERKQINSFDPWVRPESSGVVSSTAPTAAVPVKMSEFNEREARVLAGFIEDRIEVGAFSFTPAVRFEDITYDRRNNLALSDCTNPPCAGDSHVTETIPGISVAYSPTRSLNLFAGIHEGFAPPRVEDAIGNDGGSIEVDAESSINIEAGVRSELLPGMIIDATYFHNDFDNLVAVGSIAGANLNLAQGEAVFEGSELSVRLDSEKLLRTSLNYYTHIAWTYLWTAEQTTAFRCVDQTAPACVANGGFLQGDTAGNRQPYAPEHTVTAQIGIQKAGLFDVHLEAVFVDDQFADFLNLKTGAEHPDGPTSQAALSGQFGEIDDYLIFNLAATYTIQQTGTDLYFAMKNVFDEEYIADRTRGILPGSPQLVQFGLKQAF